MHRRSFLRTSLFASAAAVVSGVRAQEPEDSWTKTWDLALSVLAGNVKRVPGFDGLVLFEGSAYRGTWMECGPHESLAYTDLGDFVKPDAGKPSPLEVAKNTHQAFSLCNGKMGSFPQV